MAISAGVIHVNSGAAATTFTSAAFTPAANALLTAWMSARVSAATIPTISDSLGNTWTLVSGTNTKNGNMCSALYYWRAPSSPSSMTVTVTSAGATGVGLLVMGYTGSSTDTSNVGVSVNAAGDPAPTLPLGAGAATSTGLCFGAFNAGSAPTVTPSAVGYSSVVNSVPATNLRHTLFVDTSSPAANPSWTSTATDSVSVVWELKEETSVTGTVAQTTTIAAQAAAGLNTLAGFPVVTNTQTSTGSGTSHTVTLPSGLVSGDVCLIVMGAGGTSSNLTWPGGWTRIADQPVTPIISVAYRVCDGSEGASITVTTVQTVASEFVAHRITGAHQTTAPEAGITATQSATTANPDALTPSWGAENTLWIAVASGAQTPLPSYPTSYDHSQNAIANNGHLATAARQVNTATEDPGAFTYGASLVRRAATVAVRVAAAPAVTGTIAQTLAIASQGATGTVTAAAAVTGTVAQAIGSAAQAASGTVTAAAAVTGTVVQTTGSAAQALSGTNTAPAAVSGTIVQGPSVAQQSATGSVATAGAIVGQIDQTTHVAVQSATGTVTAAAAVTGTVAQTTGPATQAATGTVSVAGAITGTIVQTAPSAQQAAVGTVSGGVVPDVRPVGGFAGWSEEAEEARRKYQRLKRRAEIELREMIEAVSRGEQWPPAPVEAILAEAAELATVLPFMPDFAGLRSQLALLEQEMRRVQYEQEMARLALEAQIREEEAMIVLLVA